MDLIASRKDRMRLSDKVEIRVPRTEAPAYLEWSLWRAFLAIDTLANKPHEVRRFKIDQDFMPISTAPGNGPDLIAEFENRIDSNTAETFRIGVWYVMMSEWNFILSHLL